MKITYGLSNLYYSKITIGVDGAVTFATPVKLPGGKELSLSPVGDDTKVYADDSVYVNISANQGYDGDLTIYDIPEDFATDILGMTKDVNGVLVENSEDVRPQFALLGEFKTDEAKKKRFVLYNCTAGRCDFASQTKEDSMTANELSIPITASPASDTGNVKATIVGTASDPKFAAWFTSVYTGAEK